MKGYAVTEEVVSRTWLGRPKWMSVRVTCAACGGVMCGGQSPERSHFLAHLMMEAHKCRMAEESA